MSLQEFDSVAIEIYNGAWVDVTHDVKSGTRPRWNRGIMSNRPADRVGHPGMFTFTLNNSISNTAGLAGYYSPGHTNCWTGWTTGLKVRLSFIFEGVPYYKYYGRIIPEGIQVEPGIYGARKVDVTAGDWMYYASRHELKGLAFAQNKKVGDVVTLVNASLPVAPLATSIDIGVETFPTIFDMVGTRTTTLAEYTRAALSEWAYIYPTGDLTGGETLVVENQTHRTSATAPGVLPLATSESGFLEDEAGDYILDEAGDRIVLDETQTAAFDGVMTSGMQVSYGKTLANRVNSSVYPRRVDAAATTVLWALNKSFKINPKETVTGYRGAYRDPSNPSVKVSGISMAAMVSGTDYTATANEDGTGANMVASLTVTPDFTDNAAVTFTLYNSHATDPLWIQILQVKGKGVYTYETIDNTQDDAASQLNHEVIPLSIDMKYLSDANKARAFASYVLSKNANPRMTIEACPIWANMDSMRMYGFLLLEPGTKASFVEQQTGTNKEYFINGYTAEIFASKDGPRVLWSPVLTDDPGFYTFGQWDSGLWDSALWGT